MPLKKKRNKIDPFFSNFLLRGNWIISYKYFVGNFILNELELIYLHTG